MTNIVVTTQDYIASEDNQLSFAAGDKIIVSERNEETGWWKGKLQKNDEIGIFPATYVQEGRSEKDNLKATETAIELGDTKVVIDHSIIDDSDEEKKDNKSKSKKVKNGKHTKKEQHNHMSTRQTRKYSKQMKHDTKETLLHHDVQSSAVAGAKSADPNADVYYAGNSKYQFNPQSKSRFGLAAHYMAYCSSISSFFGGFVAIYWWYYGPAYLHITRYWYLWQGLYCIPVSLALFIWEKIWGQSRKARILPFRGLITFLLTTPMFTTNVTILCGLQWLITEVWCVLSWYYGEEYDTRPKKRGSKKQRSRWSYVSPKYYYAKLKKWIRNTRQQSKVKKYTFAFLFVAMNIFYVTDVYFYNAAIVTAGRQALKKGTALDKNGVYLSYDTIEALADDNDGRVITSWLPWAKLFGSLLDINCAFILIPVCRGFIRQLYNISTDQSTLSRYFAFMLSFMPLDKAMQWHKLQAFLVFIGTVCHTFVHFLGYCDVPATYDAIYGLTVWASGVTIILAMQLMFCTSIVAVRHANFELFWYTHHLFMVFFVGILFHGRDSFNPNFWKWFLVPGCMYLFERVLREIRGSYGVGVVSVTHLNNKTAKVFCLELEKIGPIKDHAEGQYVFIKSPMISPWQWHPFTISSPPDQKTLTLHIRNMGDGTWSDQLQSYFQAMSPHKAYYEAYHRRGLILTPQRRGPDNNYLICIDGPMAAPTQHLGKYVTSIIVGAGIGVTPVRAALQSIVYYRFKRGVGNTFPNTAYCVWIVNYTQLEAYRFMVRTIKETEDELYDIRKKHAAEMEGKGVEIHVFITRVPKDRLRDNFEFSKAEVGSDDDMDPDDMSIDDYDKDLGKWGPHYAKESGIMDVAAAASGTSVSQIASEKAPFTEDDIWHALKYPTKNPTQIGNVIIHNGRPNWPTFFDPIAKKHVGQTMGVMYCGPSIIASDLKKNCGNFTDFSKGTVFLLHKENF